MAWACCISKVTSVRSSTRTAPNKRYFPITIPAKLPITPLRKPDGEWLRLEIALPGSPVWLRAWQVQVGRVKLYLLDSNDAANFPAHRGITSELYGGGPELRLKQELLLGISGWRLLAALGIKPEVCHLNEGHAAFAVLERARDFMQETGHNFEVALATTRAGNLFTTHTAVAAGFDRFPPALIEQYLAGYARTQLGISTHDLLALGRQNPNDAAEPFNIAYLAIRGSAAVNGVSRLHGQVSRQLFEPLFPRWPTAEVPIEHVTNGVHMPTWDSAAADDIWTEACGKERWLGGAEMLEHDIRRIPDARLWQFRTRRPQVPHRIRAPATVPAIGRLRFVLRSGRCATVVRQQHPDARLCPPLCHLQTSQSSPARSRAAVATAVERPATSSATHHRGQGASGGPGGAGHDPAVDAVPPPPRRRGSTSSS